MEREDAAVKSVDLAMSSSVRLAAASPQI